MVFRGTQPARAGGGVKRHQPRHRPQDGHNDHGRLGNVLSRFSARVPRGQRTDDAGKIARSAGLRRLGRTRQGALGAASSAIKPANIGRGGEVAPPTNETVPNRKAANSRANTFFSATSMRAGGPRRNRTAVGGFAVPCLTTRPSDLTAPLSCACSPWSSGARCRYNAAAQVEAGFPWHTRRRANSWSMGSFAQTR